MPREIRHFVKSKSQSCSRQLMRSIVLERITLLLSFQIMAYSKHSRKTGEEKKDELTVTNLPKHKRSGVARRWQLNTAVP